MPEHHIHLHLDQGAKTATVRKSTTHAVPIAKVDEEQHVVFGWLYVSEEADGTQVVDHSEQYILAEDLEPAAYDYVLSSRAASYMHEQFYSPGGTVLAACCESVVTTRAKQADWGVTMKVGWWVGYKIYDESLWGLIKTGELKMFSIGGEGMLEDDATA